MLPTTDFRYDVFFEHSPDLLCIAGFDGYFRKVNSAVMKTLGYSKDELYTRPIYEFMHPEDRKVTSSARAELTKGKPLHNFENRYITKSGEIVWLAWTSMPFEDDQVIFAIAKNITHKKNIEIGRNEMLVDLTKKIDNLTHVSYMTSHDLRSPVNNLLSVFNLIDLSKIADVETLQLVEFLKISSEKLKGLLAKYDDVLDTQNHGHAKIHVVSLTSVFNDVIHSINSLVTSSNLRIVTDFSKADTIIFNETYLYSILLNLVSNAIKYAKPSETPAISISTAKIEGFTQLVFSDNGIGFEMDKVNDRIFGRHQKFTSHADSKGVGLFLVYNHITGLGGKIDLQSAPNQGSTFTILFRDARVETGLKPA